MTEFERTFWTGIAGTLTVFELNDPSAWTPNSDKETIKRASAIQQSFRYSTKLPLLSKASVIQQGLTWTLELPRVSKNRPAACRRRNKRGPQTVTLCIVSRVVLEH